MFLCGTVRWSEEPARLQSLLTIVQQKPSPLRQSEIWPQLQSMDYNLSGFRFSLKESFCSYLESYAQLYHNRHRGSWFLMKGFFWFSRYNFKNVNAAYLKLWRVSADCVSMLFILRHCRTYQAKMQIRMELCRVMRGKMNNWGETLKRVIISLVNQVVL